MRDRGDRPFKQIEPPVNIADRIEPCKAVGNWRILRYERPARPRFGRGSTAYVTPPSQSSRLYRFDSHEMPGSTITTASGAPSQARVLLSLLLLWLAGNGLRLTILAVPPVIPLIHDELSLNATQVGILTGLPSMLLALAAVPGSLLIARLGVRSALVVGLLLTAIGGALRGLLPDVAWLYAMTIATGAGVAIMQVTMPSAVRAWTPSRIGFATAVYTNGLLIGEVLPVALMLPLVLPLVGGSWQWGFVVWSIPVAIIAALVLVFAPRQTAINGTAAPRRRWWPDWRNHLIWRLGFMLGTVNAVYFSTNAFLPDYLRAHGQGEWISAALSALNMGQLPASFLLLAIAGASAPSLSRPGAPQEMKFFLTPV